MDTKERTKKQIEEELKKVKGGDWEEYYGSFTPKELEIYHSIFHKQQQLEEKNERGNKGEIKTNI